MRIGVTHVTHVTGETHVTGVTYIRNGSTPLAICKNTRFVCFSGFIDHMGYTGHTAFPFTHIISCAKVAVSTGTTLPIT
jgi:hypothetical protein